MFAEDGLERARVGTRVAQRMHGSLEPVAGDHQRRQLLERIVETTDLDAYGVVRGRLRELGELSVGAVIRAAAAGLVGRGRSRERDGREVRSLTVRGLG